MTIEIALRAAQIAEAVAPDAPATEAATSHARAALDINQSKAEQKWHIWQALQNARNASGEAATPEQVAKAQRAYRRAA